MMFSKSLAVIEIQPSLLSTTRQCHPKVMTLLTALLLADNVRSRRHFPMDPGVVFLLMKDTASSPFVFPGAQRWKLYE